MYVQDLKNNDNFLIAQGKTYFAIYKIWEVRKPEQLADLQVKLYFSMHLHPIFSPKPLKISRGEELCWKLIN